VDVDGNLRRVWSVYLGLALRGLDAQRLVGIMSEFDEHRSVLLDTEWMLGLQLDPATQMLLRTFAEGGKVLACGNGGSAAQASHLVGELTIRFIHDRRALAAVSLASDAVALTAAGNDYGFERAFSRQVEALGQPGDCLVAFSTSGTSKNVNEALAMASRIGMRTLGVSGRKGFTAHCDVDLIVPSSSTARIQEMHLLITHLLLTGVEKHLPALPNKRMVVDLDLQAMYTVP